jgi:hypothetical protein
VLATASDARVRNPAEAIRVAEDVCRLDGRKDPTTLNTLAMAYAVGGRPADAVREARAALAMLKNSSMPQLERQLREIIRRCEAGESFPIRPKGETGEP